MSNRAAATREVALILEDEPIIAFSLEDLLLDLGFQKVLAGSTLREAYDLIDHAKVAVAILDVNIHNEQSYPFAHELLKRSIPFIFATGYGDARHPADLQFVPTITKPYTRSTLEGVLASLKI